MISSRNVENAEYALLKTYTNSTKEEKIKSAAATIEESINLAVKSAAGGEFLKNVKIYKVDNTLFSVEGDVWGIKNAVAEFRGFRIGDGVIFEEIVSSRKVLLHQGKIDAIKNDNSVYFKEFTTNKVYEVPFTQLTKANWSKEEIEQFKKQGNFPSELVKNNKTDNLDDDAYSSSKSASVANSPQILKIGDLVEFYKNGYYLRGTIVSVTGMFAKIQLQDGKRNLVNLDKLTLIK